MENHFWLKDFTIISDWLTVLVEIYSMAAVCQAAIPWALHVLVSLHSQETCKIGSVLSPLFRWEMEVKKGDLSSQDHIITEETNSNSGCLVVESEQRNYSTILHKYLERNKKNWISVAVNGKNEDMIEKISRGKCYWKTSFLPLPSGNIVHRISRKQ